MLISEMDPPIINATSFSAANPSSYTLAEIWPFPINGTDSPGTAGGGGLGLRMTGFGETTTNRDVSIEESTVTDQSGSRGAGKKRRDVNSEDGSSKLVSVNINNANDLVVSLSFLFPLFSPTIYFYYFFSLLLLPYICGLLILVSKKK